MFAQSQSNYFISKKAELSECLISYPSLGNFSFVLRSLTGFCMKAYFYGSFRLEIFILKLTIPWGLKYIEKVPFFCISLHCWNIENLKLLNNSVFAYNDNIYIVDFRHQYSRAQCITYYRQPCFGL